MSAIEYVKAGDTVPLETQPLYTSAGAAVTGSTNIRVDIRRDDGLFFDFADSTFKSSGWTTRQATATEVSSTNAPGSYRTTVDTTGWSAGHYVVRFSEVSTTNASNLPATGTLVVGGIHVASLAASSIAAAAIASDAITSAKIADGAITAAKLADNAITSAKIAADAIGASQIAADAIGASELAAGAANKIADAQLDRSLSGHTTSGTAGEALSRLDAAITTRATASAVSAIGTAVAALPTASDTATAVWGAGTRTLSGIGSSGIASQTSVNNLPTAGGIADAVCDELLSGHTISGSVGEALGRLDVAVSTRSSLTAPQVWSTALPGAFSAGSAGFLVGTYLDIAVSSRLASSSYTAAPTAAQVAAQVLGTAVPGAFASGSLGFVIGTNLDVIVSTRLAASSYVAPPSAAVITDAVWDEALADHAGAGSAGAKLSSLSAAPSANAVASQVWATAEGTPTAGTFGYAVWLLRMGLTNRLEESAGSPGLLKLYADDAVTPLKTWQLRDGAGNAVTAATGAPAKRGAAT